MFILSYIIHYHTFNSLHFYTFSNVAAIIDIHENFAWVNSIQFHCPHILIVVILLKLDYLWFFMLNCNIFLWIGWFLWQRKDFAQNLLLWSLNQSFKVRLIFFQTISFIMSQYIFHICFIMSFYIIFEIMSQWWKSRESISVPWKLFKAHLTNIRSQEEKRRRKKRE